MKKIDKVLTAVIPVYNNFDDLLDLTERFSTTMGSNVKNLEIVYVDNGSDDGCSKLLDQLADNYSEVKVVHLAGHYCKMAALLAGFNKAAGASIIVYNIEERIRPDQIIKLLPYLEEHDLVVGRAVYSKKTPLTSFFSKLNSGFKYILIERNPRGVFPSLMVIKKDIIDEFYFFEGMEFFLPAIARMKGFKVTEIPVERYSKIKGKRRRIIKDYFDILAIRWMRKREIDYRLKGEK